MVIGRLMQGWHKILSKIASMWHILFNCWFYVNSCIFDIWIVLQVNLLLFYLSCPSWPFKPCDLNSKLPLLGSLFTGEAVGRTEELKISTRCFKPLPKVSWGHLWYHAVKDALCCEGLTLNTTPHDALINIKLQCCLFLRLRTGDHCSSLLQPPDITMVTRSVQNCSEAICCCRNGLFVKTLTFMRFFPIIIFFFHWLGDEHPLEWQNCYLRLIKTVYTMVLGEIKILKAVMLWWIVTLQHDYLSPSRYRTGVTTSLWMEKSWRARWRWWWTLPTATWVLSLSSMCGFLDSPSRLRCQTQSWAR